MTYPHGPPPPRRGARPRPVIDGKEQRWRWWLMRVDLERQCYKFFHDVERYDEACLFADVAVRMGIGGDWIVWDGEKREPTAYDTRKLRAAGKFDDTSERPTVRDVSKTNAPES